ncbi:hypothetical protein [Nonomuraea sp. 10N515B]|uniref:hypothetical protein n=1 Tax=Nonomuraea sp. 10N515B TaxID=3457422 RepID=UPI003FCE2745
MSTQLALWTPRRRGRRRRRGRWVPRCDDCGRRIRAAESLRVGPDGKRRGDKCRRAYNRARRRLCIPTAIPVRTWRDIPGQLAIPDPDQERP